MEERRHGRWAPGPVAVSPHIAVFWAAAAVALSFRTLGWIGPVMTVLGALGMGILGSAALGRWRSPRLLRHWEAEEDEIAVVLRLSVPGREDSRDEGALCLVDGFLHYRGEGTSWSVRAADVRATAKGFFDDDRHVTLTVIDDRRERVLRAMLRRWMTTEAEGVSVHPPRDARPGAIVGPMAAAIVGSVLISLVIGPSGWRQVAMLVAILTLGIVLARIVYLRPRRPVPARPVAKPSVGVPVDRERTAA